MILNNLKSQQGFSLLELLIYMAILAGFLVVIVNIFFMISTSSAREEARAEVQQNLRFAAQEIANEIRSATAVTVPASGASGNVLDITVGGVTSEYSVSGGVLRKTRGAATENITTGKVSVSTASPIFTRVDNTGAKPTIQIILTISYNDNGLADYKFSSASETAVSLKQ